MANQTSTAGPEFYEFVQHVPCKPCNSEDNGALYKDGHTKCWKCGHYTFPPGKSKPEIEGPFLEVFVAGIEDRKIRRNTCAKFGYGFAQATLSIAKYMSEAAKSGQEGVRVGEWLQVAPYFDLTGKLVAQKLRSKSKIFFCIGSTKTAGLFGQQLWRTKGKRLVITEGEIDCLAVAQVFGLTWQVVSLPNGSKSAESALKRSLAFLQGYEEVVLFFDRDSEGDAAVEVAANILEPGQSKVVKFLYKDACEGLKHEGGEKLIVNAVFGASAWSPPGLISGPDAWDKFADEVVGDRMPLGYPNIDERMRGGPLRGDITMVGGGTGSGKSTVGRDQIVKQSRGGKVGVVVLEETPEEQIGWLLSMFAGSDSDNMDRVEQRGVFDQSISDQIVFYDNGSAGLGSDTLLARMRHMIKGEGCNLIVLDHITIIVAGDESEGGDRKAIDLLMKRLVGLRNETGCSFVVMSHLTRPNGVPFERGRRIEITDFRGSSMIEALSNNMIAVERDQQAEDIDAKNTVTLRLLKCRKRGSAVGAVDRVRWDEDKFTLSPVDSSEVAVAETNTDFWEKQ